MSSSLSSLFWRHIREKGGGGGGTQNDIWKYTTKIHMKSLKQRNEQFSDLPDEKRSQSHNNSESIFAIEQMC